MHYAYSGSSSQPDAVDGAKGAPSPGCHLEVNSLCVLVALDFIQYTIGFEKNIFWTILMWKEATKTMLANEDNTCSSLCVQLTVRIHIAIHQLIRSIDLNGLISSGTQGEPVPNCGQGFLASSQNRQWGEWVCRVQRPTRHIIGHIGDESFQAINRQWGDVNVCRCHSSLLSSVNGLNRGDLRHWKLPLWHWACVRGPWKRCRHRLAFILIIWPMY